MMDEEVMKHSGRGGGIEVQSSGQVSAIGSTSTVNPEPYAPRRPVPPFLESLYKIVTNGRQDIVRWDSEERSKAQLVIINKKIFLEEEVPQDKAKDKKGASEPPLSALLSPPLECPRNGDADLFSTISSATEISPVGLFTTPPAASFPSTLMVVPESCNAQRACEYDPATDDSHLKSMIDIELLTHPVASVRSRSLYIGSKNAVKIVKDESSTPKTVQFSAKRAQLECMYSDGAMARKKVTRTMKTLENANYSSVLEVANTFIMPRIGEPKLDIPPTEVTERGMQLITAKDINYILDISDATSLSTSWRSLGRDGAIRHHLDDMENRTCGITKMKVGHGSSTLRVIETVNVTSDTSLAGKNIVRQPLNVSMQYNIH